MDGAANSAAIFSDRLKRFIRLRFLYVAVLALAGISTEIVSGSPRANILSDIITAGVALGVNGFFWWGTVKNNHKLNQIIGSLAIALDMLVATYILFTHGGIESRSFVLYVIPILAAGIMFTRIAAITTAAACAATYSTLITLHHFEIISPSNVLFPELHLDRGYLAESVVFYSAVLMIVSLLANLASRIMEENQLDLLHQKNVATEAQHLAKLGSWEWDVNRNSITWSDELYRLFGVQKSAANSSFGQYLNLVHPEDKAKVEETVRQALVEKQSFKVEHRVILPDGQVRIIHGEGRVQVNSSDEVVKMVGTAQDVTEQALIQQQLEKRSTELEETREAILKVLEDLEKEKVTIEQERVKDDALVKSLGEGLIVIDQDGRIIRVNPSALEALGFSENDLIGQWFPKILPVLDEKGKEIPPFDRPVVQALSTGKAVSRIVSYVRKDKSMFPAQVTVSPFLVQEVPAGAIVVFRDITEEQKLEQAKEEFVSLASHQLRTPATGVKAFASMLADGYAGKLSPKQAEFLNKVIDSNERQLQIIEDMLNVARADAGRLILVKENFDVVSMVDDVVVEQKATIESRKQSLAFEKPPGAIKVNADPKRYRMVVENILSNASKYTPEGGKITIQVTSDFGKVNVGIKDTGVGIAKKDLGTLFSRFGRIDNPLATKVGGTGLGLYLAKEIMDLHGGKIHVKSEPGKGTEFTVELPLKTGSPQKASPKVKLA